MGFANVLCCPTTDDRSLTAVAKAIFSLMGVANYSERESSNYVGGHYFVAETEHVTLRIMLADDVANEDLPFWIHASSASFNGRELNDWVDQQVRRFLLPAGFRAARMTNYLLRDGEVRVDYLGA